MNNLTKIRQTSIGRDGSDPSYSFFLSASRAFGAAATANFEQEWSKLITAAQQEGTLSIASGGAPSRQYRPVVDAFSKKFNIKVEVSTGNATDTVNRVLAERKGGKFTVDVALISSRENQQRLVPSDSLLPLPPLLFHPEVIDTVEVVPGQHMYADKFGKFTLIYHAGLEDQYEIWYNTEKSKKRKSPRSSNRPTSSIRSGKAKSPAKAWATRPAFAK